MTDHTDIVERLANAGYAVAGLSRLHDWRNPREVYETTLDVYKEIEQAAAEITRLRAEAEALRKALSAIVDRDFTFFDGCVDRNTITYGEIQQARAALSAQPVAGAVAQQDQQADALRFRWLCEHPDWHFIERLCREFVADSRMEFLAELRRVIDARRSVELGPFEEHVATQPQAAPAPEPSAQAVAHPSHQTVREWMPVSEALRLSDLWTAGDLDNCGQWRAAIKVLADEVRALAASPQPEPSAQGEPVAWCALTPSGKIAYFEGKPMVMPGPVGNEHHPHALILASAPSTQLPAVVEAVQTKKGGASE